MSDIIPAPQSGYWPGKRTFIEVRQLDGITTYWVNLRGAGEPIPCNTYAQAAIVATVIEEA